MCVLINMLGKVHIYSERLYGGVCKIVLKEDSCIIPVCLMGWWHGLIGCFKRPNVILACMYIDISYICIDG